jgi:hypothetical protein
MTTATSPYITKLLRELDLPVRVYLAGKIRKHCWRHRLISGLRDHRWCDGVLYQEDFDYVGPFFVGCDHGCYHKPSTHGNGFGCTPSYDISRKEVANLCRKAVDSSHLLFCYIDAPDCYGTIAEIERAHIRGIRVVIAFAPNMSDPRFNDFWFVCVDAYKVHFNVREQDLWALFSKTLKELS